MIPLRAHSPGMFMPRHRCRWRAARPWKGGGGVRIAGQRWDETVLALTRLLRVRRGVPQARRQRVRVLASPTMQLGWRLAGRSAQPPEPVLPAGAVAADMGARQAAVREYDHRVV